MSSEESTLISKGTCPQCGEERAYGLYSDGHGYCFAGCGYSPAEGETKRPDKEAVRVVDRALLDATKERNPYAGFEKRKLEAATLKRYGVFAAGHDGKPVQVYPYYDQQGNLVAQKLRDGFKNFPVLKGEGYTALGDCQLFGRHVYGDKFDRQLIITEGELDALTVAQALAFKVAVVSIGTGAGNAAKHLKANYLWVDRFKDIVLWFDNDDAGRQAVAECAPLFKVGKVRVAQANGLMIDERTPCKDASDMLQAGRPGDIITAIYAAHGWRPRGIVNAKDNPEDVLAPKEGDHAFSFEWPWEEVTKQFGPMLPGQLIYHVAGTGIGKSTAVASIAFHAIEQGAKVAFFSFEGTRREIKLALLTIHSGRRVDLEPLPDDQMLELHKAAFGSGHVELFDPETAEWSMDALEGYIRYAAKGLDCQLVVVDPLSTMVALMSAETDERRALDKVGMTLAVASKELGINTHVSHHLTRPHGIPHEEGAPTSLNEVRGSGGLANFATIVIGHERNQQAGGEDWLLTQLRALKNRPRSKTGPMVTLEYSMATGQLSRTTRKFPPPGKPEQGGDTKQGGFAPVAQGDDY